MAWQPRPKNDRLVAELQAGIDHAPPDTLPGLGVGADDLVALQRHLEGRVLIPGMPGYEEARWRNSSYPDLEEPLLIVFCEVVTDVAWCLELARKHDLEFAPRSGGHSTVGYGVARGMVIDLSEIDGVMLEKEVIRVQAGANLGKVYKELEARDLHIPGGECDSVGVAGHMQGGGYGFTSRQFGLNCDVVEGITMMLADGGVVAADATQNTDLYRAVRGGTGNNFGVLLEIRYRVAPLKELWGVSLLWPIADAPDLLVELQKSYMREGAPRELGYQLAFATVDGALSFVMMCMFDGTEEDGRKVLAPLYELAEPRELLSRVDRYSALNEALIRSFYKEAPPEGTFELKTSAYVAEPLARDAWSEIVQSFSETPNPFNIMAMEVYGGRVSEIPAEETAFVHREVDGDLFMDSFFNEHWEYDDRAEAERWLAALTAVVSKYSNGEKYQNYPEKNLPGYRTAYWGDAFDDLLRIKLKYDPDDFFRFEQGIHPEEGTAPPLPAPGPIVYEPWAGPGMLTRSGA